MKPRRQSEVQFIDIKKPISTIDWLQAHGAQEHQNLRPHRRGGQLHPRGDGARLHPVGRDDAGKAARARARLRVVRAAQPKRPPDARGRATPARGQPDAPGRRRGLPHRPEAGRGLRHAEDRRLGLAARGRARPGALRALAHLPARVRLDPPADARRAVRDAAPQRHRRAAPARRAHGAARVGQGLRGPRRGRLCRRRDRSFGKKDEGPA